MSFWQLPRDVIKYMITDCTSEDINLQYQTALRLSATCKTGRQIIFIHLSKFFEDVFEQRIWPDIFLYFKIQIWEINPIGLLQSLGNGIQGILIVLKNMHYCRAVSKINCQSVLLGNEKLNQQKFNYLRERIKYYQEITNIGNEESQVISKKIGRLERDLVNFELDLINAEIIKNLGSFLKIKLYVNFLFVGDYSIKIDPPQRIYYRIKEQLNAEGTRYRARCVCFQILDPVTYSYSVSSNRCVRGYLFGSYESKKWYIEDSKDFNRVEPYAYAI